MSDAFGVWVSESWIENIFTAIGFAPQHTYCLLTKNPQRMKGWADYQKNIWWGTTVTDVDDTDRIRQLQEINSDNRFISFEPLLADPGVIDLTGIKGVIIGAQTKPLIMPPEPANIRVIFAASQVGTKIFYKDSIIDNNPTNMMFSRELPWNLYTKEATR
jgi:protein gp37